MHHPHDPHGSSLVVFGKVPWMGDFLRVGAPSRTGEALEHWVEQGLGRADSRFGATWESAYARGSTHAFFFRSARGVPRETLAGVILPSRDAVGRSFPLLVYAPLISSPSARGEIAWPHVLPMALGDFFDAAAAVLHAAGRYSGQAQLLDALTALPSPRVDHSDVQAHEYAAWTSSARLTQALGVVFGEARDHLGPRAVHVIGEAVAPFRGDPSPATTLGLRLPLGSGGAAAAAFWLDVVRRLAGAPNEIRTSFWSFDGERGSVIVQLGETPPSTLAELWAPDADSETMCDLTEASSIATRLPSELPPPLAAALQSPETLVADFLDRLAH
jgi:type VI secretion system ImpM family protein